MTFMLSVYEPPFAIKMVAPKHTFDFVESIEFNTTTFDSYSFESLSRENVCLTKRESFLKKVSQHFQESTER